MILNLLLYISFFYSFILINANKQFHFGIINHHTQWYFHCPQNFTRIFDPPSNDQPLISYECPNPRLSMEILPIEIDFTILCRSESRLFWVIIDLYQYNTYFWLIDSKDLEIKIELNNNIKLNNSKIELKNYTNHYIIINAFYIPFESLDILLNKQMEINIEIKNLNQINQCQFIIKDNYSWKIFLENKCDSDQSKTYFIQNAKCHFYSNKSFDKNLQVQTTDNISITTTSINTISSTNKINSELNPTTISIPYQHHYLLLEENYRQILSILARSTRHSRLLKLTFIFLLIILIILILFFLYMLCYHYHTRSKTLSSLIKKSSVSI